MQKYHILHGSDISLVPILGEFVDSRRMISGLNSICAGNQCCSDLLTAVRRIASRAICWYGGRIEESFGSDISACLLSP